MLEALGSADAFFCTFTFSEEGNEARDVEDRGSVYVREAQLLLRRIRERCGPCRYFVVGELGERSGRPHYHAMLFVPGGADFDKDELAACWPYGFVHLGFCEPASAGYLVSYVTKGISGRGGLKAEFARMSLRPGIGVPGLDPLVEWCQSRAGARFIAETGDVPKVFKTGGKVFPLGRYLLRQLRMRVGVHEPDGAVKDALLDFSRERYVELSEVGALAKDASMRRQHERKAWARVRLKNSLRRL